MQSLTADPRGAFTDAQILAMLHAPDFRVEPGVELLDSADNTVDDLTDFLEPGGTVSRDCNADIHGSCSLTLDKKLVWGRDRLRPYVTCSSRLLAVTDARFNLGIFLATSPTTPLGDRDGITGEIVSQWSVTGYDKNYFLSLPVGDSIQVLAGAHVITQVEGFINDATGGDPKVAIDQTAASATLAADMSYPITSGSTTYLTVINALLKAINYRPIWVDQDGYYRSEPITDPALAASEYTLDVQAASNVMADPRTLTQDTFSVPNWWRFLQNGLSGAPVEGNGQYTYTDTSDSLTSYATRGYYLRSVQSVDAVNQNTLVNLAQQQIRADTNIPEAWSAPTSPLPQSGHFDIIDYKDVDIDNGVTSRKCQVQSWTFNLDGTDMDRTMNTAEVVTL